MSRRGILAGMPTARAGCGVRPSRPHCAARESHAGSRSPPSTPRYHAGTFGVRGCPTSAAPRSPPVPAGPRRPRVTRPDRRPNGPRGTPARLRSRRSPLTGAREAGDWGPYSAHLDWNFLSPPERGAQGGSQCGHGQAAGLCRSGGVAANVQIVHADRRAIRTRTAVPPEFGVDRLVRCEWCRRS